ncbi:sulfotransferase domain-containing protein [Flavobacteriaceae bacterium]|nr:sulfotransferase domain-containing protein [Flavobacteriaceae bacterium]
MSFIKKFTNPNFSKRVLKKWNTVTRKYKVTHPLNNYKTVVWLFGSGRSGTTWIADLINYKGEKRELFEPFHPIFNKDFNHLELHQYYDNDSKDYLKKKYREIFSGKFYFPNADYFNNKSIYKGLLVKDIFSNMFAKEIIEDNQNVRPLFLIRFPFDVALSKTDNKSSYWQGNPIEFLKQDSLVKDYLSPFTALIEQIQKENDPICKHILTWAIINYVPLKKLNKDDAYIVFYEEVFLNPKEETSNILNYIYKTATNYNIPDSVINKKSRVSPNKTFQERKLSMKWKERITDEQYKTSMYILEQFGFDKLYNENKIPQRTVLDSFLNNNSNV